MIIGLSLFVFSCFFAEAKVLKYELVATKESINLSGKREVNFALMLNGAIPGPILEFTEGDEAEIVVKNNIADEELSIHWHGILLDPAMDGVPYVNTPPIRSGESFTFKFKLRQHGTYWYHSHTNVQEQKGLYGAIVIHPRNKKISYDKDFVVVVSDWSDENATQILHNLRKEGDYYIFKKKTMRSWWGAIRAGSLGSFLYNEWTRMGGMDYSDVAYDAFLINGKKEGMGLKALPGEKIRIRIINAAASTYFHVSLGQAPMKIIALDGVDIAPTLADEFLIGMAETYDLLFVVPDNKSYELKASAQDGTGTTSTWIGMGDKVFAPQKTLPDLYASMMGHESIHHHSSKGHEATNVIKAFSVDDAMAAEETHFAETITRHEVKLVLDGDMERYVWHINGKAIHEERTIMIREGEVVRFTFVNNSMMHHPMHLHGHFFRVLNKHGKRSPLKHTVDIAPHTTKVIEFFTDEPGEWMLHCHNLYHLKTGMARVVKYSSYNPSSQIQQFQKEDPHLEDHIFHRGLVELATNHAQAELFFMRTWDELELRAELRQDFDWKGEGDLFYKRWLNKWAHLIAGGTMFHGEGAAVAGFGYILPFLFETHTIIDHAGRLRFNIEKRFQWTDVIYSDAEFTFRQKRPSEFEVTLMYQRQWAWSTGLMFTEKSAGVGLQYQF